MSTPVYHLEQEDESVEMTVSFPVPPSTHAKDVAVAVRAVVPVRAVGVRR